MENAKVLTQAEIMKITFDSYIERVKTCIHRMDNVLTLFEGNYDEKTMDTLRKYASSLVETKSRLDDVMKEIDEYIADGCVILEGANEDVCEDGIAKYEAFLFDLERCTKSFATPPLKAGTFNFGDDYNSDEEILNSILN